MKSKSGDGIGAEAAANCLRVLIRDLVSAIAIDEDLGKEMKSKSGDGIGAGAAVNCLRVLVRDLVSAIAIDEDLKEKPFPEFFLLYFWIIYMMAAGRVDPSRHIYQMNRQMDLGLTEEEIHYHISRVESDYGEFVPIMRSITNSKLKDFVYLGASEEEAYNCLYDWIVSESF